MWAGTLIQDNGYWGSAGVELCSRLAAAKPLHDAEVYAYIEKKLQRYN